MGDEVVSKRLSIMSISPKPITKLFLRFALFTSVVLSIAYLPQIAIGAAARK